MILFFDTETTGKADFNAEPEEPHQPRLVQLAALLGNPDGSIAAGFDLTVVPDGFEIPAEASKIHGITTAQAKLVGVNSFVALELFAEFVRVADTMVAYNSDYDRLVMAGEYFRHFKPIPWMGRTPEVKWNDPMRDAAPLCKLPGGRGGEYKWPKLAEAHQILCGKPMQDAHDAMGDVRALVSVYWAINF